MSVLVMVSVLVMAEALGEESRRCNEIEIAFLRFEVFPHEKIEKTEDSLLIPPRGFWKGKNKKKMKTEKKRGHDWSAVPVTPPRRL